MFLKVLNFQQFCVVHESAFWYQRHKVAISCKCFLVETSSFRDGFGSTNSITILISGFSASFSKRPMTSSSFLSLQFLMEKRKHESLKVTNYLDCFSSWLMQISLQSLQSLVFWGLLGPIRGLIFEVFLRPILKVLQMFIVGIGRIFCYCRLNFSAFSSPLNEPLKNIHTGCPSKFCHTI